MDVIFESSHPELRRNQVALEGLIRRLVEWFSQSLDLVFLEAVIVADDFGGVIERFQKEYGVVKTGYTNDAVFGRAIAKNTSL